MSLVMDKERLFTVNEIAAYLGLSKQRIYDIIRDGEMRALKLKTGTVRIPESALDEFLAPSEED